MLVRSLVSGTVTDTYTLAHNADNRLVEVMGAGSTTTYTYNGDLAQVIAVKEGSQFVTKTIYIGSYYEYQIVATLTSTVATTRTYYFAGSTRVDMRDNGTLIFLLSDHLGSTSLTTDASGGVLSVQKYMPYGKVRGVGGLETAVCEFQRGSEDDHLMRMMGKGVQNPCSFFAVCWSSRVLARDQTGPRPGATVSPISFVR